MDPRTEPRAPGRRRAAPGAPAPPAASPITLELPRDSEPLGKAAAKPATDGGEMPKLAPPITLEPPPARPLQPQPVSPVIAIGGLDAVPENPKPQKEAPANAPVPAAPGATQTNPTNDGKVSAPPT